MDSLQDEDSVEEKIASLERFILELESSICAYSLSLRHAHRNITKIVKVLKKNGIYIPKGVFDDDDEEEWRE